MTERVVVIGAGGFGRETLDIVEALIAAGEPLELVGVVDAGPRPEDLERLKARGIPYLGNEATWLETARGDRFIIAIGAPSVRASIAKRLSSTGLHAITVVHPRAVIGSRVNIGEGAVIASGVQISTNVSIGDHVHVNPGAIVGHDSTLAAFVSVNPGAIVSGNVDVEAGALLGAGSVTLQGLRIGADVIIGAAACVTKDVARGTVVAGVPAKQLKVRGAA